MLAVQLFSTLILVAGLLLLKSTIQCGLAALLQCRPTIRAPFGHRAHEIPLFPFGAVDLQESSSARWRWIVTVSAGLVICWAMAVLALVPAGYGAMRWSSEPVIGGVVPNSPAERAGLRAGDRFKQIDGHLVSSFDDVRTAVSSATGALKVTLDRNGNVLPVSVEPKDGRIGITQGEEMRTLVETLVASAKIATLMPYSIVKYLIAPQPEGALTTSSKELFAHLPDKSPWVRIYKVYSFAVSSYLSLLAFILLLPIPPLDGWQILRTMRRRQAEAEVA